MMFPLSFLSVSVHPQEVTAMLAACLRLLLLLPLVCCVPSPSRPPSRLCRRWGGRGGWQTGTAGPGHAQKPPLPILCASQASIVVILISTSEKTLFCRTRGVILQPLPSSSTEEPSNLDANYLSFTCRAKQTAK